MVTFSKANFIAVKFNTCPKINIYFTTKSLSAAKLHEVDIVGKQEVSGSYFGDFRRDQLCQVLFLNRGVIMMR